MRRDKLNTLNSFMNEGFKIERNGKVITLSLDEMTMFRHLDKSQNGHYSIECLTENDEDYEFAKQYLDNEEVCFFITEAFEERVFYDVIDIEMECAREVLDGYRDEE